MGVHFFEGTLWFDRHMRPAFDVDVYSEPFPVDRGYHIYHQGRADLLLLRLEDLSTVVRRALSEFLGVHVGTVEKANISEDKLYAAEYRLFRERIRMPERYIDAMYNTRYMRHFYNAGEIARFRQIWNPH